MRLCFLALIPVVAFAEPLSIERGQIEGVVRGENGLPQAGARVFVRGIPQEWSTDAQGHFVLDLPIGKHALTIIHQGFSSPVLDNVLVNAKRATVVSITLNPASMELNEYVVLAPRIEGSLASLNEERRSSTTMSDRMGSEQFAKAGDSTAAAALRRVSGLSLVDGKYVYVRGLGERYSSTLFNGSTLPSPELSRRVVPLDIFPTGILENVTVQKTYSPHLPGEFGGGVIELNTKGIPEKPIFATSFGLGYGLGSTGTTGKTYQGGKLDWLGFDDGTRTLPQVIKKTNRVVPATQANPSGYSDAELQGIGTKLSNIYSTKSQTIPPDASLSLTWGERFSLGGSSVLGTSFALMYNNAWENGSFVEVDYSDPQRSGMLIPVKQYSTNYTDNKVRVGNVITVGFTANPKHSLEIVSTLVRNSRNSVSEASGFNMAEGDETPRRQTKLRWQENMLLVEQIHGKHILPLDKDFVVSWDYTWSRASRDEPDKRSYTHSAVNGVWQLSKLPERYYSSLIDNNHSANLGINIPLYVDDNQKLDIKTGLAFTTRARESDLRRFKWVGGSGTVWTQNLESVFSQEHIGAGSSRFHLEESTVNTDNYRAKQSVKAAYLIFEYQYGAWRIAPGSRIENSLQEVETFDLHSADAEAVKAKLQTSGFMPSLNLAWEGIEKMPLRFAYSRTVARPDFKELSPAPFWDDRNDSMTRGNPDLKETQIHNWDLRWEWYFSPRESVSIGGFLKEFREPVEIYQTGALDRSSSYRNVLGARNSGIELDGRKDLGFIFEPLREVSFGGNISYIYSRVRLGDVGYQTSKERPLQGQSPYVLNLNIEYESVVRGVTASLLYNVNGKRIVALGEAGVPDIEEEPSHRIDFVSSYKLSDRLSLKGQIKNLLREGVRYVQGDKVAFKEEGNLEASIGLSGSF